MMTKNLLALENITALKYRLSKTKTREKALKELGDWLIGICLLFGVSISTAYQIAALMTKGIKESRGNDISPEQAERYLDLIDNLRGKEGKYENQQD